MFSVDTSGFVEAWNRLYARDVFPTLWTQIEAAAAAQTIVAVVDVREELERQDDELCKWAKQHVHFIALDTAIQEEAANVLTTYPRLVDSNRSRSLADPFVIGLAKARGFTVVTTERRATTPGQRRPKIPDVCAGLGVPCSSPLEMFRSLGWKL